MELMINGIAIPAATITEAEALIAILVLRKVSINANGKKLIPVVQFKEVEAEPKKTVQVSQRD